MLTSHPKKRYRCRFCGAMLPAAKRPEGSMLLSHLGQDHLEAVRPYLQRMKTECSNAVLHELYELVEAP
jgi:hypothetical protein